MTRKTRDRLISALVWLLCVAPLLLFVWQGLTDGLTANPIEYVLRELGLWGLRFLCITLAISPLAKVLKMPALLRYRRRIGLWAFAYVALHLIMYVAVDQQFGWSFIVADIVKRPYITIGMAAFVLLVPLAITSANRIRRKMRVRAWRRLHQLVYLIAIMGVVHYFLLVKADTRSPLIYGGIVAALLGWRAVMRLRAGSARPASAASQLDQPAPSL
ncbi:sulfoxide reductase heme-binding subunit YedZ [Sphingobium sp. B1D7B]|uniref:sulfite oxidase heme-binding subunit YedZ n=1 Tax=unclassified Sphingobium TaxID=2611147 RepID=UPI0022257FAD|nr:MULTISPECIES: protein-methionine-sulfoxide reductase heme-binding subunit MsrQ [unclassified Sphingobium]MCW2392219.1 sulfoxide reductase heme-binding subunit YedZ [Sphingobium sp. B11D3A]MCW2403925.1 sulfoxide reductase heme-binding subunit YedZ [Sphingobium sp. B1D7B]